MLYLESVNKAMCFIVDKFPSDVICLSNTH